MAITQNGVLKRDDNDTAVMGGTSSVDNATIINSSYDPITRRLLVDNSGSSSGTPVNNETPAGTINGINTVFTLAHTPISGTLLLFLNGQFQHPTAEYTITTNTITYVTAPDILFSGLPFTAVYSY